MTNFYAPLEANPTVADEFDDSPKAIRAWARENDIPIGVRGRVAAEVRNQYLEAHGRLDTNQE